jgi:hypothetical protein
MRMPISAVRIRDRGVETDHGQTEAEHTQHAEEHGAESARQKREGERRSHRADVDRC